MTTVYEKVMAMNVKQFWHVFCDDYALFTLRDFHLSCKDKEVRISRWFPDELFNKDKSVNDDNKLYAVRDVAARVSVKSPIGPPTTRLHKVQRLHMTKIKEKDQDNEPLYQFEIESFCTTPDMPFSDCFYVIDKWVIRDLGNNMCKVTMAVGPKFIKKPWKILPFVTIIENRVKADGLQLYSDYLTRAQIFIDKYPDKVKVACQNKKFPPAVLAPTEEENNNVDDTSPATLMGTGGTASSVESSGADVGTSRTVSSPTDIVLGWSIKERPWITAPIALLMLFLSLTKRGHALLTESWLPYFTSPACWIDFLLIVLGCALWQRQNEILTQQQALADRFTDLEKRSAHGLTGNIHANYFQTTQE
jgi:hypothetical protein